jgi:site-specific DNA-methyltransferase (adenine-specific)
VTLHHGDCREVLAGLPDASVDAVVTDPPYELGFMGKAWDAQGVAYDAALWAEVLRVLKPGGHLLAFGGTRTYHRLACAVEDAGFEVRDSIHWLYGSGFPKSLDVSKAIDKAAGAEREVVGDKLDRPGYHLSGHSSGTGAFGHGLGSSTTQTRLASALITAPATPEAARWEGWGTALKPAHEPVVVARKPLAGTVAANVLAHGTGALNVDGCRVGTDGGTAGCTAGPSNGILGDVLNGDFGKPVDGLGRWPANVVLDPEAAEVLDRQSGDDEAGASRFFTVAGFTDDDLTSFRYVAKPDRAERNAGLDGLPEVQMQVGDERPSGGSWERRNRNETIKQNFHPTVKPLDLMRWLVRLVTPPGGTVLEPFAGSGTTLAAAVLEGFDAVGIELTADYLPLIEGRVAWAEREARFGPVQGPTQVRKETPGAVSLFDEVDE